MTALVDGTTVVRDTHGNQQHSQESEPRRTPAGELARLLAQAYAGMPLFP